jgi:hypothetical protein
VAKPDGLVVVDPDTELEFLHHLERAVLVIGRAEIAQAGMRLGMEALRQCRGDARLAEAGFARDRLRRLSRR